MNEVAAYFLLVPIFLQGACTLADEFFYHRKRGLPPWEIWGHPLDTLSVAVCYSFLLLASPSPANSWIFLCLAAFSCLFVTKDEFVHKKVCSAQEQWLHSLLFLLHPIAFGAAGLLWWRGQHWLLWPQLGAVTVFLMYQILYWGQPWRFKKA